MRRVLTVLYAAAALVLLPAHAHAFGYSCGTDESPGTVRLVVPLGAGSANDVYARHLAEQLKRPEYLNRTVLVENMPGGYGSIAAKHVAAMPSDGCTLFVGINSTFAVGPMFGLETVDFVKDLTPITAFIQSIQVFSVNPSLGVKTLDQFLEYVKMHPKLDIATSAGSARVAGEMLAKALGTNGSIKTVPYRLEPEA
ncbi:MAG: tripartite tricarboxylate transporter substrate-binding protein, partial [Candidatus Paceibacterota bacterium]